MAWPGTESRSIIHLNVADFAVAVERVIDSRLRDRPVIVAAPGASRSAVYDMSEEAYREGIRKGMAVRRARTLCPKAEVVSPHPHHYERAMQRLFKETRRFSPLVESEEISGHLFMDLTGSGRLFGPPPDVAWRIRKDVRSDLGFDPIWSVAPNKLIAKVATRLVKPDGEYIVQPGEEEDFLRPLPIHILPGLEKEDIMAFREFHITHIGQAAIWTPDQLTTVFGKRGHDFFQAFRGIDRAPVRPVGQKESLAQAEHEFGEDTNDQARIEAVLYQLVERAGAGLRKNGLAARRTAVRLDYSDGVRIIRQKTDPAGTANDFKLFALARTALALAWQRRVRIRHIRLVCDRLIHPSAQYDLFAPLESEPRMTDRLVDAFDQIRQRFGHQAVYMGRTLAAGEAS